MQQRAGTDDNTRYERQVLSSVLAAYPELFTASDLVRLLTNPANALERDGVERALSGLATSGLILRCHPLVIPTPAALRCHRLSQA